MQNLAEARDLKTPHSPMRRSVFSQIRQSHITASILESVPGFTLIKPPRIKLTEKRNGFTIKNITIIDMEPNSKPFVGNILVKHDKIVGIHASDSEKDVLGEIIDGTGKYIIPSLIECHCHIESILGNWMKPLYMAAGVTSVRDMATPHKKWTKIGPGGNFDDLHFYGPRVFPVAGFFDGHPGVFSWALIPENRNEVRYYLDEIIDCKIKAIKIYSYITGEMLEIIAAEAMKRDLYITGHVPMALDMYKAAELGMNEFEHNMGIPETILKINDIDFNQSLSRQGHYWGKIKNMQDELRKLATDMKNLNIVHVPTYSVVKGMGYADTSKVHKDTRLQYLPALFPNLIWSTKMPGISTWESEDFKAMRDNINISAQYTRYLYEEGGTILAGTDCPMFSLPGFSLQDELENLVSHSGFSPYDALASATCKAANVIGVAEKIGSIKEGKTADLLLLDKNPLDDIKSVTEIHALIFNGKIAANSEIEKNLQKISDVFSGFLSQKIMNPVVNGLFNSMVNRFIPPQKKD